MKQHYSLIEFEMNYEYFSYSKRYLKYTFYTQIDELLLQQGFHL